MTGLRALLCAALPAAAAVALPIYWEGRPGASGLDGARSHGSEAAIGAVGDVRGFGTPGDERGRGAAEIPRAGLRTSRSSSPTAVAAMGRGLKSLPLRERQRQYSGQMFPQKGKLQLGECRPGGKWPPLDTFDLVISWWTNRHQSNITQVAKAGASLLETGSKSRIENQAEIKYALRSFQRFGMLDYVRHVYVLMDDAVLSQFGAPRYFNYSNKAFRIVTDRDLGLALCNQTSCGAAGQWSKLLRMHTIPGLSDYFVWLPDDVFMMRQFKLDSFWDVARQRPNLYTFGTWGCGWCAGLSKVGSLHGPVVLQRCAMQAVLDSYLGTGENQTNLIRKAIQRNRPIDALCLFTRAMTPEWTYLGRHQQFHRECHTNNYRGRCGFDGGALFLNIQGYGVSDEYGTNHTMSESAHRFMPQGSGSYFHSYFPNASRFET